MSNAWERTDAPDVDAGRGLIVVGRGGRIVEVDDLACAALGSAPEALTGRRLDDVLPLDATPGERLHLRQDGTAAWLLVDATATGDDAEHLRVTVRDVTLARGLAEDERAASARLRHAVEGSWVLDRDGRTDTISAGAAALIGRDPDEVRGRSPLDFVHEGDRGLLEDALRRRRTGHRESYELRWRRGDGGTVWCLMSATAICDPAGEFAGSFALMTDVTALRAADERLERHARQQEALARLGRLALDDVDQARLLDEAVRICADVLRVRYAGVFALGDDDRLDLVAVHGMPPGAARDLQIRAGDDLPTAEELATGDPIVIADWTLEQRHVLPVDVARLGVRSTTVVAVKGRRLHGMLSASRDVPWTPDADEVRFLESVAHVLAAARDRADAELAGHQRSLHDALTGLPNRTLALDRLDQALRRRGDGDDASSIAVIAVDLDHFKHVNDTAGAGAGDQVVCAVGARLRGLVGPADTVARLAGDAFVVVCADLPADEAAAAVAARIVEELRAPVEIAGEPLALTASAGVAVARGDQGAGDLLRDAETALDRAKAQGRDRFEVFDEAVRARAVERVRLERDLRLALARGELFVAYQPIVTVGGGNVTGMEALVRWRHPERGIVPPGDFIALAEELGLIGEIGLWVLRAACAETATRHRAGRPLTCHVNLSPLQALDPTLPETVAQVLADTGLPPEALVLELTESSLMEAGEGPLCVMQGIRGLGVRLVLDDFGTGYSSLARLRHFPIDGLKIDRLFVTDLDGSSPADALVVAGIVELARALGLTVVAEGVETTGQLRRLRRLGCRYAQGFLLARPAPASELDALLAQPSLVPVAA